MDKKKIPLFLKLLMTAFMAILIPAYWIHYGPSNFLWISDVTLILAFVAVLFENRLFASMAAVGGLVLEILWTIAFLTHLIYPHFAGIIDYMFDPSILLWLRLLSLFHIFLPFLLLWLVARLGYEKKAVILQIPLIWSVVILSWALTEPSKNINWVFSYQDIGMDPIPYLILECLLLACILLMTHMLLIKFRNLFHQKLRK